MASEVRGRRTLGARVRGTVLFLCEFVREPSTVGSVFPSSKALAKALIAPFRARTRPASVLEVGAGTGAVTRHLGREMRAGDRLTVCEMQPKLARHIEREVLTQPQFEGPMREHRVRLLNCRVEEIDRSETFDFVVCGLPFSAFEKPQVEEVFQAMMSIVTPDTVFSYFEYIALRRLGAMTPLVPGKKRMRAVSALMDEMIERYQFERSTVLGNFPPTVVHYWRFAGSNGRCGAGSDGADSGVGRRSGADGQRGGGRGGGVDMAGGGS